MELVDISTKRMSARVLGLTLVTLIALFAASCGSSDEAVIEAATENTETPTASGEASADVASATGTDTDAGLTLAGVEAAQWSNNVDITVDDGTFRFVSDGLPSHELPDQFLVPNDGNMPPFDGDSISDEFHVADTDGLIVASPLNVEITLNPVYSEEITQTGLSTIGVMISGAQLFNDYEDQTREFIALDDNLSLDGAYFIDACNGHPLATGASYHYHGVPYCITDTVDVAGQHSTIIGVLIDGFPVYGPQDVDGTFLTNADLDECSGHDGATPEFPDGIYHYHLTEDASPYSIDCFHGEIDYGGDGGGQGGPPPGAADEGAAGGPPRGGGGPDLSDAASALGVSVEELQAALGQPPFDLDAAATALGLAVADLEALLPAAPADGGGGPPPAPGDADDADTTAAATGPVDETEAAIRSAVVLEALWADNVDITIDGNVVRFESDGLPAHEYLDVYLGDGRDGKFVAGGVDAYDAVFQFPLVPTVAAAPSPTRGGAIGVAISGAVYFNPYEGNGTDTVANDDNETIDGIPFIDACGGHPLPTGLTYHYHGIPFCITDAIDTVGQHSVLIGYLFDGFPIYGPQDVGGAEPTDLDACLGHTGPTPEFDEDTYHYHVISTANYISECLTGVS